MRDNKLLLNKYNIPVPRYTSYPPANFFSAPLTSSEYVNYLKNSNTNPQQNISLYFHIPFCRKRCFYCGCNAYALGNINEVNDYVRALHKELGMIAGQLDPARKVSQVHLGGGTPNELDIDQLGGIIGAISTLFDFTNEPEIAIECNPAYLDEKYIEGLAKLGFNRISLGIQDFDARILKAVNRLPSKLFPDELIAYLRNSIPGISINFDFIYGLPGQTASSFMHSIGEAIRLAPDRIVTFSYAHMPSIFKRQALLKEVDLPKADVKMEMFLKTHAFLIDNKYRAIGFDHFAREGDELSIAQKTKTLHRNFQGYCTKKTNGQVYALGVSGISQLENLYTQNTKSIPDYMTGMSREEFVIEKSYVLTQEDKIIRHVINELMCNLEVDFREVADSFQISVGDVMESIQFDAGSIQSFQEDGLITYNEFKINLHEDGILFVRNIAASLDPRWMQSGKLFSKSV